MKRISLFLLFAILLSSCAPAVPTQATAIPTQTTIPSTDTPFPPTLTPTPSPENLADAKNLSTWIGNYVNAYGGKVTVNGVEMDANQLLNEIKTNSDSFTQAKQVNGIEFSFLVVNGVPLAIRQSGNLNWEKVTLRKMAEMLNFNIGTVIQARPEQYDIIASEFNLLNVAYDTDWNNVESKQGQLIFENKSKWAFADKHIEFAREHKMRIMSNLFYYVTYPDWLINGNFTKDELKSLATKRIYDLTSRYPDTDSWNVLNEYFPLSYSFHTGDIFQKVIGAKEFLLFAFSEARRLAPNAQLILNYNYNETLKSVNYALTLEQINQIKDAGIDNIAVGMQMHLLGATPPQKDDVIKAMKSFGVPVVVIEFDVNMKDVKADDRLLIQAEIYKQMLEACIESGVCKKFSTFQIGDNTSWLENGGYLGAVNSDATLYFDDLTPKPAYYSVMQALYEHLP